MKFVMRARFTLRLRSLGVLVSLLLISGAGCFFGGEADSDLESSDGEPAVGRAPTREEIKQILRGPLRMLRVEHIRRSVIAVNDLQIIASLPEDDLVFRAILDKRLGDLRSKTKRDARTEVEEEYERRQAGELERIRKEERELAREDLGVEMAGNGSVGNLVDSRRDPSRVLRPSV